MTSLPAGFVRRCMPDFAEIMQIAAMRAPGLRRRRVPAAVRPVGEVQLYRVHHYA